ncbi:pantoate--beta-alanine ligase [Subtercola frigoramans]|uniref:Pantothenate synthetase n=1 Tax=Subtercola frigoramans TaxID=120298 RepID=A0ABS2L231_9MICO|nr:pantoate--beta-alanine ligase [Subtercola frigoramans]MBM7471145.1 pantoate--beta-alanine ligase [Subtercola frigoramans]
MSILAVSIAEVREQIAAATHAARSQGTANPVVALVPTMGALHAGHLALVARAREMADVVVVSIFVNPLQFGEAEDLDRYPRDLTGDRAALDEATASAVPRPGSGSSSVGEIIVFAPSAAEMYPDGKTQTKISAGNVGNLLEGRSRAGHFDGVLVVVNKLLNIARPDVVLFGQKDAQQVFVVSRMVRDLNIPVVVEVVETVREDDGLALSSRNRFLDKGERLAARVLSQTLEAAESAASSGIDAVIAAAQSASMGEPLVKLEYLAVVNPKSFLPVDDNYHGKAIVAVAARVGSTRLIDNESVYLG